MTNLFEHSATNHQATSAPLAERMRPQTLDEVLGQEHLTGGEGSLRRHVESGSIPNVVLVGPPGAGKTTLARIAARTAGLKLEELSAVACGLPDVRRVISDARQHLGATGQQTVLFLDEIHRFNKAQQDALLPAVEAGVLRLVGATTENPYVSINRALLSRVVVYALRTLTADDLAPLLNRATSDTERGLSRDRTFHLSDEACAEIVVRSTGDARVALTLLESAAVLAATGVPAGDTATIALADVEAASDRRPLAYDRAGDYHYDTISAYIKSMRAGDADGAMLYLATMLEGGEDPMFVARRLVIFASEDVGLADPQALQLASAALAATEKIGMPEARIILGHVTAYCANAAKDRSAYSAINAAMDRVRREGAPRIPEHLLNTDERQRIHQGRS